MKIITLVVLLSLFFIPANMSGQVPKIMGVFSEIELSGVFAPYDKETSTIQLTGQLNLIEMDGDDISNNPDIGEITISVKTEQFTFDITVKDGKFSHSFEYPQLDPGIHHNFITISCNNKNVNSQPQTVDLVVIKDALEINFDQTVFEYSDETSIGGDIIQINEFTNGTILGLDYNNRRIINSTINNGKFSFLIPEVLPIGTYSYEIYLEESQYYQQVAEKIEISIVSGIGNYSYENYNGSIVYHETDVLKISTHHKNRSVSAANLTIGINNTIFNNLTDINGVVQFNLWGAVDRQISDVSAEKLL